MQLAGESGDADKSAGRPAQGSFALGLADLASYLVPGSFIASTTLIALVYESGHNLQWIYRLLTESPFSKTDSLIGRTEIMIGSVFAFFGIAYLLGHLCAVLAVVVCERIMVRNIRGYPYRTLLFHDTPLSDGELHRRNYYRVMIVLFFGWLLVVLGLYLNSMPVDICTPFWACPDWLSLPWLHNAMFWLLVLLLLIAFIWGLLNKDGIATSPGAMRWPWPAKPQRHLPNRRDATWHFRMGTAVIDAARLFCWAVSVLIYPLEYLLLDKFLGLSEHFDDSERDRIFDRIMDKTEQRVPPVVQSTAVFWIPYLSVMSEGSAAARFLERQNLNGVLVRNMVPALIVGAFQLVPLAKNVRNISAEAKARCDNLMPSANLKPYVLTEQCANLEQYLSVFTILSIGQLPYVVFALGLICIVRYYHLMYQRFSRPLFRYFAQMPK